MSRYVKKISRKTWLIFGLAMWVIALVGLRATVPAGPSPAVPAGEKPALAAEASPRVQQMAAPADYVGEDTCLTCHEGQSYQGTLHAMKSNARTPAATHGCESCHGPGKAHVEGGGDKTKIVNPKNLEPRDASEMCTTCHDRGTHALWSGSQHDQRNVSCSACHSVHSPKGPKQLTKATEFELCSTCHRQITNKQKRLNHMPVREGAIVCSSCHNPHGSANVKLLKVGTTVDESCTSCHPEKRGPYLWEHAPVADSCVNCHDPHGSNNDRMLVAKVPYLCQRCHVTSRHPPTVYDGYTLQNSQNANKIFAKGCISCHQQIHGSNAPSGKAFLR
jgi:DmsE family decaheme c-type cytochrome